MAKKISSLISQHYSQKWCRWLIKSALPFWYEKGFQQENALFYERLSWDGTPSPLKEQRLMVQARQIVTYGRAFLDGIYDVRLAVLSCIEKIESLYYHRDGERGWVFSLTPEGEIAQNKRDLYAHAFILLAYGWIYRITKDEHYKKIAYQTSLEIGEIFQAGNGGYLTDNSATSFYRSQNPHMHLLEAYLLLFEVTQEAFYLEEAWKIINFAARYFIDEKTGFLLEFLDSSLSFLTQDAQNYIEPGHQFEWVWLLQEYLRVSQKKGEEKEKIVFMMKRLLKNALEYGIEKEKGLVWDSLSPQGLVRSHNVRIWPQTEFLRILMNRKSTIFEGILKEEARALLIENASAEMFEKFLKEELAGGWVDHLDEAGQVIGDYMPASSLYHIYGAAREFL